MKKASVRDLHIRTSELVRQAAQGDVILIERRGQPVAELRPLAKNKPRPKLPNMSRFWNKFPKVAGDSGAFLEQDR